MKSDPLSPTALGIDPVTTIKKLAHKDGGLREVSISLARVNFGEAATGYAPREDDRSRQPADWCQALARETWIISRGAFRPGNNPSVRIIMGYGSNCHPGARV
jgi:hypothetical protein